MVKVLKNEMIVIACFVAVIASAGCQKNTVSHTFSMNDTIEIRCRETKYNYDHTVRIRFDSLLSDARCPVGAVCIWAGNAVIQLTLTYKASETVFNLNTPGNNRLKSDSVIQGYRIQLLALSQDSSFEGEVKKGNSRARLLIKKDL